MAIRYSLGQERATEFIIDVQAHNTVSARGIEKAGFTPVGHVAYLTVLNHWLVATSVDLGHLEWRKPT